MRTIPSLSIIITSAIRSAAKVAIITNYGRMLFYFAIPRQHPLIPFQRIRCTQINATNDGNNDCHRLQTIMEGHHYLIRLAGNHLKKQIDQIQKLIHEIPIRQRRRVTRGWGSEILSSLTGLSTQESVDKIVSILRRVEMGVNQASEA